MNRILMILSIVLPLTVACQKNDDTTLQNGTTTTTNTTERPRLVRTADGRFMDVPCLKQNADEFDRAFKSGGIESARGLMDKYCNIRGFAAEDRKRACAPCCNIGQNQYTSYYYPPAYYQPSNYQQNTNVNLTFNNYFFNGGGNNYNNYGYNGYQMFGYNPQQSYNPYPPGYQTNPYYNQSYGYNYNNYNYGGNSSYQQGQPFYLNTNYYNPAPSNQFCNTAQNGANTCWFGGQTQQFTSGNYGQSGATVIQ